ncbi:hypothetical protein GH714_030357 [Hevea brasiliensis]|uniref:Uncharacterized protein n=1 Tax=Hevea brasiliensis TaxID=3981 RepID=A0A6A6NBS0_HEVBR|nr:hypothetical protein GH714_030357 [Hevea brasiliensis]
MLHKRPTSHGSQQLATLSAIYGAPFSHRGVEGTYQKAQSYMVQAKEREDRVKAIKGKVADLEEQISRLKVEIIELKVEEASLIRLEDNLLVDHMTDRGVILSKWDALWELAAPKG